MSKPRYIWWGYVKGMIRQYPEREAEYLAGQEMWTTASYNPQAGGSVGASRRTEDVVLRQMERTATREYMAVRNALARAEARSDGALRVELVKLVYWQRTHTIAGAATRLHVSERTARRWHRDFVYTVAAEYGLI